METSNLLNIIIDNVEKVIIGKKTVIELALCALICKGHILIEDVPGVGKTSLVSSLARSVDCSFKRIQFTPDILPSDITGFSMFNQKNGEFVYRQGAIMSQIVLADEINRTSPKTQSALLEVMEENQVTVDGSTYSVPTPFMVLATQNPVEYLGTFPLPEAQLDRFFMKISIGYPTHDEEVDMINRFKLSNPLEELKPVVSSDEIILLQKKVQDIIIDKKVMNYIVTLVADTRTNSDVSLGASPRASICLAKAAQAWALYSGRNFVMPDDVQKMLIPVLGHRILITQEAKFRKTTPEAVIKSAVQRVRVPVI